MWSNANNNSISNRFHVKSGVKQGAVISLVVFCCYFYKLLFNIGYFNGKMFIGALGSCCVNVSCNAQYAICL